MRATLLREPLDVAVGARRAALVLRGDDRPFALIGAWAGGGALLGSEPVRVAAPGRRPVRAARRRARGRRATRRGVGGGWVGFLGFEARHRVERGHPPPPRPVPLPDGALAFYDHVAAPRRRRALVVRGARHARARGRARAPPRRSSPPGSPTRRRRGRSRPATGAGPRRRAGTPRPSRRAASGSAAGDLFQANLCLRLEGRLAGRRVRPLRDRRGRAPHRPRRVRRGPVGDGGEPVAGGVPHAHAAATVRSAPIKGTRPADRRAELEASAKDRAENVMIVDLVRNDLGRVCRPGTVRVTALAEVAAARRRLAPRLRGRGRAARRRRRRRPAARDVPARLGHRRAEARRARRDRRAGVDRPRGVHRRDRLRRPARRARAERRHPHVRGPRHAHLARRRRRDRRRLGGRRRGARGAAKAAPLLAAIGAGAAAGRRRRAATVAAARRPARPAAGAAPRPGGRAVRDDPRRRRAAAGARRPPRAARGEPARALPARAAARPRRPRRRRGRAATTARGCASTSIPGEDATLTVTPLRRSPPASCCAPSSSPAASARTSGATARCSSRTRPTTRRRSRCSLDADGLVLETSRTNVVVRGRRRDAAHAARGRPHPPRRDRGARRRPPARRSRSPTSTQPRAVYVTSALRGRRPATLAAQRTENSRTAQGAGTVGAMKPKAESLRDVPLFSDLAKRDLKQLADSMKEHEFAAGAEVVAQGKGGVGFFVILEGTARVTRGGERARHALGGRLLRRDGADRRRGPRGVRPRRHGPPLREHDDVELPPVREGAPGRRLGAADRARQAGAPGAGPRSRRARRLELSPAARTRAG